MISMAITPVSGINLSQAIRKSVQAEAPADSFVSFGDMLSSAVRQVNITDGIAKQDAVKIATGQADDLHTIMIDSAKADLAVQTLVQVRNKALDAYTEIMRMTL
jgi:flagellar hook-basal body complex protein FliE